MIGTKVRWGIVSAGRISNTFAQDMAQVTNGRIVAVAARKETDAADFARQYDIPKFYEGYQALFNDSEVDAVYISTPHSCHLDNCIDALEAGKAILCEKPITLNPEECKQIMEAAEVKGLYVMEAMWTWFLPAIVKAKAWIDEGRIGRIKHIKADFGYPIKYDPYLREYHKDLGGGCLLEMGVYPVALNWLFMRQDPKYIHVVETMAPNGVEQDVVMVFNYEDSVSILTTSFNCRLGNGAYIIGDEGYVHIPDFFRAYDCALYHLDERIDYFHDDRKTHGFNYEIQAAGEDILAGRTQSETVSLLDSLAFQEHMALVKNHFTGETT